MAALVGILFVVILAENAILPIPWLTSEQMINIGSICALMYPLIAVVIFRNQLSNLESFSSHTWRLLDSFILLVLLALPWLCAVIDLSSVRFAYTSTLMLGITIAIGRWLRIDTLTLVLLAIFIAQTALWSAVEFTPLQHLMFMLDPLPPHVMGIVSVLSLGVCVLAISAFKRKEN